MHEITSWYKFEEDMPRIGSQIAVFIYPDIMIGYFGKDKSGFYLTPIMPEKLHPRSTKGKIGFCVSDVHGWTRIPMIIPPAGPRCIGKGKP